MELRLLSDTSYAEEFDITVDEITDQYVAGEFSPREREQVELYFLRASDRHEKVGIASALAQHAATSTVAAEDPAPVPIRPTFFEQVLAFWHAQSSVLRVAVAFGLVAVVGLAAYLATTSNRVYVALTLNISSNETRGVDSQQQKVVRASNAAGVEVTLRLPEETAVSPNYRVVLINSHGTSNEIPITQRGPQALTLRIPASQLKPDSYAIKLYTVNTDGTEQVINGSYFFDVE